MDPDEHAHRLAPPMLLPRPLPLRLGLLSPPAVDVLRESRCVPSPSPSPSPAPSPRPRAWRAGAPRASWRGLPRAVRGRARPRAARLAPAPLPPARREAPAAGADSAASGAWAGGGSAAAGSTGGGSAVGGFAGGGGAGGCSAWGGSGRRLRWRRRALRPAAAEERRRHDRPARLAACAEARATRDPDAPDPQPRRRATGSAAQRPARERGHQPAVLLHHDPGGAACRPARAPSTGRARGWR